MGYVILIGLVVMLFTAIGIYNSLIDRRNRVDQAYSTIEVQLTQRYDLISKLVETVRQYMGHERSLLEDIVRLRQNAITSPDAATRIEADNKLSRAMGQLNVTMENYPELRSSDTFVQLQRSLNEVEEQLSAARRSYNASVVEYNNSIEQFPSSLLASPFGHARRKMFVAEERKKADVDMRKLFTA